MVGEQISDITGQFPEKVEEFSTDSEKVMKENNLGFIDTQKLKEKSFSFLRSISEKLGENTIALLSTITSVATVLAVVPFLLFFYLKDEEKLMPYIIKLVPAEHEGEGKRILADVDKALFTYVTGQFIIAFVDGVLMYICYRLIGLDFALILAMFAMFLTIVPFFGPVMGMIPAFFIALLDSPFTALKVVIVLAVVQQLEGNLIIPQVMGKGLNLHPITVILLLIAAGPCMALSAF